MSIYGEWLAATIVTSGTGKTSAEVDLGRDWDFLEIQIPTIQSGTIGIEVAEKTSGTFYALGDGVTTDASTHNYADVFKLGGYQFIKVVCSFQQTTQRLVRVRGMRY